MRVLSSTIDNYYYTAGLLTLISAVSSSGLVGLCLSVACWAGPTHKVRSGTSWNHSYSVTSRSCGCSAARAQRIACAFFVRRRQARNEMVLRIYERQSTSRFIGLRAGTFAETVQEILDEIESGSENDDYW